MNNRFLTKAMVAAVLTAGVFTSCNDDFSERDFLEKQYALAEAKTAKDFARELTKLAKEHGYSIDLKKVTEAIKEENRQKYLDEYKKAGLVKKINFITLDKITGKPVAGVKVTFLGKTATSDVQGVATLEDVPVGAGDTVIEAPEGYFSATAPAYNPFTGPRIVSGGNGTAPSYWVKEVAQNIQLLPKASITKEYVTVKGTAKADIDMSNDTFENAPDGTKLLVDYAAVAGIGMNDNGAQTGTQTEFGFRAYFINDADGVLPTSTEVKDGEYSIKLPAIADIKLIAQTELEQDVTYIDDVTFEKVTKKGYFNVPASVSSAYKAMSPAQLRAEDIFDFKFSEPEAKDFELKFTNTFKPYGFYTSNDIINNYRLSSSYNDAQVTGSYPKDVVVTGNGYQSHPTVSATLSGDDEVYLRGQFTVKRREAFNVNTLTAAAYAAAVGTSGITSNPTNTNFYVFGTVIDEHGTEYTDVRLGNFQLNNTGSNIELVTSSGYLDNGRFNGIYNAHPANGYSRNATTYGRAHHSVTIEYISDSSAPTSTRRMSAADFGISFNYKDYSATNNNTTEDQNPYLLLGVKVVEDGTTPGTYSAFPKFTFSGGSPATAAQFSLGANRSSVHKVTIANSGSGYIVLPTMVYKSNGNGSNRNMFAQSSGSDKFIVDTTGKILGLTTDIEVTRTPDEVASFFTEIGSARAEAFVAIDNYKNRVVNFSYSGDQTNQSSTAGLRTGTTRINSAGAYRAKPTYTFAPKAKYAAWAADHEVEKAEFSYSHSTSNYRVSGFKVDKKGSYIDVNPMPYNTGNSYMKDFASALEGLGGKEYVHNFVFQQAKVKK